MLMFEEERNRQRMDRTDDGPINRSRRLRQDFPQAHEEFPKPSFEKNILKKRQGLNLNSFSGGRHQALVKKHINKPF